MNVEQQYSTVECILGLVGAATNTARTLSALLEVLIANGQLSPDSPLGEYAERLANAAALAESLGYALSSLAAHRQQLQDSSRHLTQRELRRMRSERNGGES